MAGRIASLVSGFFRNFRRDILFLLVLVWGVIFSLVGLFALRFGCSLADTFARLVGYEFTSWYAMLGVRTPTSDLILGLWFVALLAISFFCWLAIWCFGDRPIHWLTVLLLLVIVGFPSVYVMTQLGLQWAALIPLIPVVFCLLMVAKLMGFNRFGRWLGRKGRWWKDNVLWPWVAIPGVGLIGWFLLLMAFQSVIPTGHDWLLNDAGDWLIHWIWEPFWGVILFAFHLAVQ